MEGTLDPGGRSSRAFLAVAAGLAILASHTREMFPFRTCGHQHSARNGNLRCVETLSR